MSEAEVIQVIPAESEVRLGSLSISDPRELVSKASELATALAEIINKQQLFSVIGGRGAQKKYVRCEGWTTMGAMLGVVPVEEYCQRLPENKGFEAKVKLIRVKDGGEVGAASAECTFDEDNWANRDSYSLRSMALTRATSKAFRLSFSWIIKLAGFEPTPAEEMSQIDGSAQAAQEVGKRKVADLSDKLQQSIDSLFYIWYDESQTAEIKGAPALLERHASLLKPFVTAVNGKRTIVVNAEQFENLKYEFEKSGTPFHSLKANTRA